MKESQIGFIGGGNMASSLIGGLIADGVDPARIRVAEPDPQKRAALSARYGVRCSDDNNALAVACDTLVLSVKPQVMQEVAAALAGSVQTHRPLVVSIAAGVREADLRQWLGGSVAVVRTMPNTPALVQAGATGMFAGHYVDEEGRSRAETIMRATGIALWVENEADLDAVTALSGSGPAYFFLVMEAMEEAGKAMGLSLENARLLTLQTALGAARMAMESDVEPAELRRRVTSPGGTTERALGVFEDRDLRGAFSQAMAAARDRAAELSRQLGGEGQ
ncbi:MAG: pyrroline-5-carboxylate reductase [Chromatiales bacterium]|nr:pyrroline-5-carboxylate reductase [Chromatiales bacterium]